jgi:hypothetical protein
MNDLDDHNINLRNQLLTFAVVTVLILTGVYILYPEDTSGTNPPFQLYNNTKTLVSGSYFVKVDVNDNDREPWQYYAALSFVPVVMGEKVVGGDQIRPLIFSTSPAKPNPINKYNDLQTIDLSDYGEDANEASINIATEYWTSINTIIISSDYEHALLASPLATLLDVPIIIDGKKTNNFIKESDIKSAITVGKAKNFKNIGIKHLDTRMDIWEMYLDELGKTGDECDYIVITNPRDINYYDTDLYIPGLSLASAVLASGHNAIITTGDYTVDIEDIRKLGYGLGDAGSGERGSSPDNITEEEEEVLWTKINHYSTRIDNDIDTAYDFLKMNEQPVKYVGLVGGPAALPMVYIKSPIWWEDVPQDEKGEEYVATDTYFGDTDIKLGDSNDQINNYYYNNEDLYNQELNTGRIVAQNLGDATALVTRSLGYWNYEFEGGYLPNHWSRRALIVTSLMTGDSDNAAARHQQEKFLENNMAAEKYDPNDVATFNNVNGLDVKDQMEKVNGIIFDGHGYPDGWYHMWTSPASEEANWDRIGAEDINELTLKAVPVFGACCLSSALDWPAVGAGGSNEKEMTPENCMSLAFIHAGAMCYIGATEESWGAFIGGLFDEDIDAWGYGDFDMPTMFWHYLLNNNQEIGLALNNAKLMFLEEVWTSTENKPFAYLCVLETVLYGDPAASNGHPGYSK